MPENEKRLQFLLDLLKKTKVSKRELARRMGMSYQNMFVYFQRDDMKISFAEEMAAKLGYTLSFSLDKPSKGKETDKLIMDLESILGNSASLQRLAFLQIAMKLNGIERKKLAQQLDLNYTGVNRWFKVDDIAISYLFKIANLYNLKVKITPHKLAATPKSSAEPEE